MKLIIGLGNPGAEYSHTRHNLGADAVEALASQLSIRLSHHTLHSEWGRGVFKSEPVVLARPLTYMNISGQAVAALSHYFKINPEQILVVVDDFNLPLGAMRFRAEGSAGGHNGLKSIIEILGTAAFQRLRLGIGNPPLQWEITDYVLGRFPGEEMPAVTETLVRATQAMQCWLERGITRAMTEYN